MSPSTADLLFALLLVSLLPWLDVRRFRHMEERIAAGEPDVRLRRYRAIIIDEILLLAAVAALWLALGRPWSALTLEPPSSWQPWAAPMGWAATALAVTVLAAQALLSARSSEGRAAFRRQIGGLAFLLPRSRRELYTFQATSLAAGICEEVVYRGFAMVWLTTLARTGLGLGDGAALAAGAIGSAAMFGVGHSYQGAQGVLRTAVVGLVLAALAITTGGLLAPMLVHFMLDAVAGALGYRALAGDDDGDALPTAA